MATHDYIIANASGAAVRADLNNALAAIVSNNSGSSEPATKYAFQWWADTTTGQLKLRNAANDAWITIQELDGTMLMEDGTVGSPGLAFASDTDTGLFRPAANQLAIATNGVERVEFGTSEVVFNDGGADIDFRVEGDTNANLFLVDAGNDRVNIGSTIQVAGSRGGSLQPSDNDSLELFTSATSGDANTGCGLTFFNHDGSGSEMGGTIQVAKENGTDDNTASYMRFATRTNGSDAAERVRIDSSGRLLIGTTTEGHANGDNLTIADSGDCGITIRSGTSSEAVIYFSDATSGNGEFDGQISYLQGSQALRFATAGTEKVRIEDSGNMFIGHSTATSSTNRLLQIGGTSRSATYLEIRNSTTGDGGLVFSDGVDGSNTGYRGTVEYSHSTDLLQFKTAGENRMRIDANGQIGILANTNPITARSTASASTSTEYFTGLHGATQIHTGGTVAIKIYTNGNIQNTNNSYGSLSDAKLKENIVDASSQWDDIKGIRVRNYNFIEGQTHTQIGVVAQEIETVSPGLVFDTPDTDDDGKDLGTVTKGVNYSVLYMKAVKALQEAIDRIETLETKVAALEAN